MAWQSGYATSHNVNKSIGSRVILWSGILWMRGKDVSQRCDEPLVLTLMDKEVATPKCQFSLLGHLTESEIQPGC